MTIISNSAVSKLPLAIVVVATLALAGCGRKAGLDLPPGAGESADQTTEQSAPGPLSAAESGRSIFNPGAAEQTAPVAAPGRKRGFVLDPLLD